MAMAFTVPYYNSGYDGTCELWWAYHKSGLGVDLASKRFAGRIARACFLDIIQGFKINDSETPGALLT
jgi:hypothetical protein